MKMSKDHKNRLMANLLENTAKNLPENVTVEDFKKFTFPLIRKVRQSLIALPIGPIKKTPLQQFAEAMDDPNYDPDSPPKDYEYEKQAVPMTQPVGGVAFYRPRYGSASGQISSKDEQEASEGSTQGREGEKEIKEEIEKASSEENTAPGIHRSCLG